MADTTCNLLFVDDDPLFLEILRESFRDRFGFDSAQNAEEALELIKVKGPYAVLVADQSMPGMGGIELLAQVRTIAPETVRIMLTGDSGQRTAVEAVNRGQVFYFLNKSDSPEILAQAVESGVNSYRLTCAKRQLCDGTVAASVKLLADILGMVAPEALGRGQRLRDSMQTFAEYLDVDPAGKFPIAALLSQLGYASVPVNVMRRVTGGVALLPQEEAIIARLPQFGYDLISDLPSLKDIAKIVLYQNKCFNGVGFPQDNVSGEEIPLGARMLKILIDRMVLESDGIVKDRAHAAMMAKTGEYDPWLLDQNFLGLPAFLSNAISKDRPVLRRPVAGLAAGQILVSDVVTRSGVRLLEAGSRLTEMTINRLRHYADLGEVLEPLLVQEDGPK